MHKGYIKLWRKLQDNPLWLSEKMTRSQAWIDLLMCAAHKKHEAVIRGYGIKTVTLYPGQVLASHAYLAERWKWNSANGTGGRKRVSGYLKYLVKEQLIEQVKTEPCTIIAITNWKKYQEKGQAKEQVKAQEDGHEKGTPKNPPKGGRGASAIAAPPLIKITDELAEQERARRLAP